MNNLGSMLTLVGMAIMVLSVWEPRPTFDDEWCATAWSLRRVYRLPGRAPAAQRAALNELHTIQ